MRTGLLGCITTPKQGNRLPQGAAWAADNGCFGAGYPGDTAWYRWLAEHPGDRSRCMFAVCPDVVADAEATTQRSRPWLDPVRALGYKVAYVAQNGQDQVPVPWDRIDVLFIGGDNEFKLGQTARTLAAEAKQRGLWVHMGRVNSLKRIRYAAAIKADSVDGTILAIAPDRRLPEVLGWVHDVRHQTTLWSAS